MIDQKVAADRIRHHVSRRLAFLLDCKSEDFKREKLGSLIHLLFVLIGDTEEISGFGSSIRVVLNLVGPEIVWATPETEEDTEEKKPVVEVIN